MTKKSLTVAALLATCVAALPYAATASSHREAPAIAGMPRVDATDFYMFNSYEPGREGFVTFIANYNPIQSPYGGPNYFKLDDRARYDINIDNDGDARADLTFTFDFSSKLGGEDGKGFMLNVGGVDVAIPLRNYGPISAPGAAPINDVESYTVSLTREGSSRTRPLRGTEGARSFVKPIDNIGEKSIPNYAAYADQHVYDVMVPGCAVPGKVFVGQRAEAFAVNLGRIFDLVNLVPIAGAQPQDRANDDLVGKANITSLALELPIDCVVNGKSDDPVIGAWTTASLPDGKGFRQVSRLSNPLVNEVVIGLKDKNLFNSVDPTKDAAVATYVTNPTLPALLDILFRGPLNAPGNIAPSNFPRNDLVTAFLTGFPGLNQPADVRASEMLRLNTAIPATPRAQQQTYGVVAEDLAGFPNGRRPGDDTVDIALRVVMGALCHPLPLATELGVEGAVENTDSDNINLGLCAPADAPVGTVPFTDFAPIAATELQNAFPYLNNPIAGAVND